MPISAVHLFRQGSTLETLLKTAVRSAAHYGSKEAGCEVKIPGPVHTAVVSPRHPDLVRDFIVNMGGKHESYRGILPPCMFPQWGMSMLARTLEGFEYDLTRILNGGCSLELRAPIPADRPLHLKSWLEGFDDNGRRVVFKQTLVTGTEDLPECLIAHVAAVLPLKRDGDGTVKKERRAVPEEASEIARWRFGPDAGLDFGKLTGDMNPVHWSRAYARLSGFKSTIMHGFGVTARMVESLNRLVWSGRIDRWKTVEARFVRPLPFPSVVGLYVDWHGGAFVGDAPGGPAYLVGGYTTKQGE